MKRERMRARGPRGTHALVEMVREQVGVLIGSTERLSSDVRGLGRLVTALADRVDDHENRLTALEKKRPGRGP